MFVSLDHHLSGSERLGSALYRGVGLEAAPREDRPTCDGQHQHLRHPGHCLHCRHQTRCAPWQLPWKPTSVPAIKLIKLSVAGNESIVNAIYIYIYIYISSPEVLGVNNGLICGHAKLVNFIIKLRASNWRVDAVITGFFYLFYLCLSLSLSLSLSHIHTHTHSF